MQTIDLPVTILRFFGLDVPDAMQGRDLCDVMKRDAPVREGALFGVFGAHVCVTDGRYVLMKAPATPDNAPLYEYTLMPQHMDHAFTAEELRGAQLHPGFSFTQGCPVLQIPVQRGFAYPDLLFDLERDPQQLQPIEDEAVKARMEALLVRLMRENDAPQEQFARLGLKM